MTTGRLFVQTTWTLEAWWRLQALRWRLRLDPDVLRKETLLPAMSESVLSSQQHHQATTLAANACRSIALASRLGPRPSCLVRSIVLHGMLQDRRVNTTLRIGVSRNANPLRLHAWVELEGQPLMEPPADLDSFLPLRFGVRGQPTPKAKET